MSLKVRKATRQDASSIARIHIEGWRTAYAGIMSAEALTSLDEAEREAEFLRLIEEPPSRLLRVWVADDAGVSGFAVTGPARDDDLDADTVAELSLLYVDPTRKGTGIGKQLIAHAAGVLCIQGFADAVLWTLEKNAPARRFYEADGWSHDGTIRSDERRGGTTRSVRYRKKL